MWGALLKTALQKYGPTLASAAGSLAAGKSAGRAATNAGAANADDMMLRAQGQEENSAQGRARIEMDQKESSRDALNDAYKNALRSSLAMNMQDSVVSGLPKGVPNISFGGGMRPSAMGAEGKAAAGAMNASAMRSLLNPEALTPMGKQSHFSATPMKEAGFMENALGVAGMVGSGVDQFKARQQDEQNRNNTNTYFERLLANMKQAQGIGAAGVGASDIPLGDPTA